MMRSTEFITLRGGIRDAFGAIRRPLRTATKLAVITRDALRGRLVRVPVRFCTDVNGFAYGHPGWHPYRSLAEELRGQAKTSVDDTTFARFIRELRAPTYTDMMTFHDPALAARLPKLPYGSYPWGTLEWSPVTIEPHRFFDRATIAQRIEVYDRRRGPEAPLGIHFAKVASILRSVEHLGYRPLVGNAYPVPSVAVLAREGSAEVRYLVKDRNHFLAVLSALGCTEAWVRIDRYHFPIVWEAEIDTWPWVRSGLLDREAARTLFSLYFQLDGTERARALGIAA
jgi:hypothetical protein